MSDKVIDRRGWAEKFKRNHHCGHCPFVRNEADVGVGTIYDCDTVCSLDVDDIVEAMDSIFEYEVSA